MPAVLRSGGVAAAVRLGLAHLWARVFRSNQEPANGPRAQAGLSGLLELASEAIIVFNDEQQILVFNKGAEAIFGYRAEEILGRSLEILLPDRFHESHRDHLREFREASEPSRPMKPGGRIVGLRRDGAEFPAEASIVKRQVGDETIFTVVLRDVGAESGTVGGHGDPRQELEARVDMLEGLQRRVEHQASEAKLSNDLLSEAEARLNDVVECISEGFALWDPEDRLILCNERFRRFYPGLYDLLRPGLPFEELVREGHTRGVLTEPEGAPDAPDAPEAPSAVPDYTTLGASGLQYADGRWVRVSSRTTSAGHVVMTVSDVSDREETEATIRRMALEDALTALPNRAQFHMRLNEAIAQSERSGRVVGLMLLDLDRFKNVNDTLGHPAGDELLRQVSVRLLSCARRTDTVARLGGDEFAVIVTNCLDSEAVTHLADRMVKEIARPFWIDEHEIHSGTSIGITIYPQDHGDTHQLLLNADLALYRAKELGRGAWQVYDEAMNTAVKAQRQLEKDLRLALQGGQFHIVYQPRFEIASRRIVGAEALLRWRHPERGLIPPSEFIPVAESAGLIVSITQWLLHEVCQQNRAWQKQGLPPICVSVNLSPVHFKHHELVEQVEDALHKAGLEARYLELEITEGAAMAGGDASLRILECLKMIGVMMSIDDFGTGYSSLDRLKKFPVDRLKIDQSFVRDIMTDANDAAICSAAIRLGHSLNIGVIAEGVETEDQLRCLEEQGCEEAQGFLFSKPLAPEAFADFLRANTVKQETQKLETSRPEPALKRAGGGE